MMNVYKLFNFNSFTIVIHDTLDSSHQLFNVDSQIKCGNESNNLDKISLSFEIKKKCELMKIII